MYTLIKKRFSFSECLSLNLLVIWVLELCTKNNTGIALFIIYLMSIAYVKTTVLVVCIYLPIRVNVILLIKIFRNFHHCITVTFRSSQELSFMHVNYYSTRRNWYIPLVVEERPFHVDFYYVCSHDSPVVTFLKFCMDRVTGCLEPPVTSYLS